MDYRRLQARGIGGADRGATEGVGSETMGSAARRGGGPSGPRPALLKKGNNYRVYPSQFMGKANSIARLSLNLSPNQKWPKCPSLGHPEIHPS